ncbi:MAG: hypothetical protein ACOCOT_07555, partial [Prevotella sp.]
RIVESHKSNQNKNDEDSPTADIVCPQIEGSQRQDNCPNVELQWEFSPLFVNFWQRYNFLAENFYLCKYKYKTNTSCLTKTLIFAAEES